MSFKSKFSKAFGLLALLAVMGGIAWAADHTDTYDTATTDVSVGGIPLCVTFSGTHSTDDALVVALPKGFDPAYAVYFDAASTSAVKRYEWIKGMSTSTVYHNNGTVAPAGFSYTGDANVDAAVTTDNYFTFAAGITTNSGTYYGFICR